MENNEVITEVTPEQWAQVDAILKKWIDDQTERVPHEDIVAAVNDMWASLEHSPPLVVVAPSPPIACLWGAALVVVMDPSTSGNGAEDDSRLRESDICTRFTPELRLELLSQVKGKLPNDKYSALVTLLEDKDGTLEATLKARLGDQPRRWSIWWRAWSGWYAGAAAIGVKFDQKSYDQLQSWCRCCPFVIPFDELCVVAENPVEIHWDDSNNLHCETGPSVRYSDGWSMWTWHGVRVPQKAIEAPDTITVAEIKNEQNAEVQRILRERYGEGRYLLDTGAKVIDSDHEVARKGGAPRVLVEDDEGVRWLVGTDGSTNRTYYMRVDSSVDTCRKAHESLCGFPEDTILNKS